MKISLWESAYDDYVNVAQESQHDKLASIQFLSMPRKPLSIIALCYTIKGMFQEQIKDSNFMETLFRYIILKAFSEWVGNWSEIYIHIWLK